MTPRAPGRDRRRAGVSYVEVLVATGLLALVLLPALDALRSGLQGARVGETLTAQQLHVAAKLEEVLAQPFPDLQAAAAGNATPTAVYSDAAATPDRRLVYVAGFDADNADGDNNRFTGADPGILWVRVELEGSALALESLAGD